MARQKTESRLLKTMAEVMKALGGVHQIAALTGAYWKNVDTWHRAPKFPSRYFLVMMFALWKIGYTAPPELWGMVTPRERRQAVEAMIAAQNAQAA